MKYNPIRITHKCQPEKTYYQNIINKLSEKQYNGTRYVEKKTVVASLHIQNVCVCDLWGTFISSSQLK